MGIKFQAKNSARKTGTKGRGNHRNASCRRDQSKRRQVKLDGASGRAFADNNIQNTGFHSWIKYFFHHFIEPVNFIYKKDIASSQIGKDGSQVADFLNSWTRSNFHLPARFFGDKMREGGFSQSGRTIKKNMLRN